MPEAAGWQFEVEVHPPDWRLPAGPSWLAGWIRANGGGAATDLRAWLDGRLFLGLPGLPKPGWDEKFLGHAAPPYAGWILQIAPHRHARLLRLEARDARGVWSEFFRQAITAAPEAPECPPPLSLASRLAGLAPALLRRHARDPRAPLAALAREVVATALATPLNALPNPPFHGALEEPAATGRVRYGRLSVTGWLAHRAAKIRRLTALADDAPECALPHGLARGDVSGVFADLPGHERSQFVGQADLPPDATSPALLRIFAELENGEKHLVFAQRFTPLVLAGADAPLPPLSRLTFARALWALRGAAKHHGMPLGPRAELAAGARAAWAAWREETPPRAKRPPAPITADVAPAARKPLRILVVTHNLNFEGAPRLVFELACHLARAPGHTVRVLSPQEGPLRRLFEEAGLPVEIVDLSRALAATSAGEFHAELARAVRPDWSQVDLVLANTMVSFWAIHAAMRAGKPSLLYVHESAPIRRFFGASLPPALLPIVEDALRDATRVAFTAEASRAVFGHLDKRGRFRVLPSWLDGAAIGRFAAEHDKAGLRARLGVDPGAIVLLNLGAVCERKGQHTFLRAAALLEPELRAAHPGHRFDFVMVGAREDGYLAALRQQAADAGLRHVRFVPETRENFAWHRLADLLVCTSFEESSPRVLFEAALFGTPIVSTDVNGIPELLAADQAWLTPPGDARRLADALRAALAALLAGDTGRADRARAAVAARFDVSVSLPLHHALAHEAANSHS
jgi:glycosyltransferase involved in cell wall biosynthesis